MSQRQASRSPKDRSMWNRVENMCYLLEDKLGREDDEGVVMLVWRPSFSSADQPCRISGAIPGRSIPSFSSSPRVFTMSQVSQCRPGVYAMWSPL